MDEHGRILDEICKQVLKYEKIHYRMMCTHADSGRVDEILLGTVIGTIHGLHEAICIINGWEIKSGNETEADEMVREYEQRIDPAGNEQIGEHIKTCDKCVIRFDGYRICSKCGTTPIDHDGRRRKLYVPKNYVIESRNAERASVEEIMNLVSGIEDNVVDLVEANANRKETAATDAEARIDTSRERLREAVTALVAERDTALADVEQLSYERRLLGTSRRLLDQIANNCPSLPQEIRDAAAGQADRIADEIGHPVTDEPARGPVRTETDAAEDDCQHCSPRHGGPERCSWAVRIGSDVDGDGQPTYLIVQPSNGAHVAPADARWLLQIIRDWKPDGCASSADRDASNADDRIDHAMHLLDAYDLSVRAEMLSLVSADLDAARAARRATSECRDAIAAVLGAVSTSD